MSQILSGFEINPATWFYLSFLLTVSVYFKFTRFWSLRNLDLIALLCLTPGWLLLRQADLSRQLGLPADGALAGYIWLFVGTAWWVVRMLLDPLLHRRPLLEPNLSVSGLTFLGTALLAFLMTEVVTKPASETGVEGVRKAQELLHSNPDPAAPATEPNPPATQDAPHAQPTFGPGWPLLHLLGALPARALVNSELVANEPLPPGEEAQREQEREVSEIAACTTAILGHLAIVIGLVLIAFWHFGYLTAGVAVAVLYLLLPYTAYHVAQPDQVLVGALLVWAIAAYRRPVVAGIVLGLATGAFYFPLFLLPLWTAFYWKRGQGRFLASVTAMVVALFLVSWLTTGRLYSPGDWTHAEGFWHDFIVNAIPVFVAYVVLCGVLVFGQQPKGLAALMAHSAAVVLATQFWYMPRGGTYVLWYLPLVLLSMFRPSLTDRVAPLVARSERPATHSTAAAAPT